MFFLTKNSKLLALLVRQLNFSIKHLIFLDFFANSFKSNIALLILSLRGLATWQSLLIIFVFSPSFVFAYGLPTHRGLTDETVDFFNVSYPDFVFTEVEKELIKKGGVDEDENTQLRWMRHFYDPVYNRGLTFETETDAVLSRWQSSKTWAQDTAAQADVDPQKTTLLASTLRYFDANTDYSWDRAIYDYAWGDRERGLEALGHVLHLIQDAAVPDHTRNDPHPPVFEFGSPYESWAQRFNDQNLDIAAELKAQNKIPVLIPELNQYFDSMATYSNNNFFSKDTIFDRRYNKPNFDYEKKEILNNGKTYVFKYKVDGLDEYRLAAVEMSLVWLDYTTESQRTLINDVDHLILTDYWNRLSKQAVLHGAGVIKLFFDEVEKERRSRELLAKQEQSGGILAKITGALAGLLNKSLSYWSDRSARSDSNPSNSGGGGWAPAPPRTTHGVVRKFRSRNICEIGIFAMMRRVMLLVMICTHRRWRYSRMWRMYKRGWQICSP